MSLTDGYLAAVHVAKWYGGMVWYGRCLYDGYLAAEASGSSFGKVWYGMV